MQQDLEHLKDLEWQIPHPYISDWTIKSEDIDHYYHTNNIAYLKRLESLAWEHSNTLGLNFEEYQRLDRAMVITKHDLNYHFATHLNDVIAVATWIVYCDKKFKLNRYFQFINTFSKKTVFTAKTEFVCVSLSTGTPKRMPLEFSEIYGNANKRTMFANEEPELAF